MKTIRTVLLLIVIINNKIHITESYSASTHDISDKSKELSKEKEIRSVVSKNIQRYMNLSIDPCEDFYEYACGSWWEYHSQLLMPGELRTAQQLLETNIATQLQNLLVQPLSQPYHLNQQNTNRFPNIRKTQEFYSACINVNTNGIERRTFLNEFVRELGGLPSLTRKGWKHAYHWLHTLSELRRNYGFDILIGLSIDLNLQQMRGNSIYLGEPKLTILPSEHCNFRTMQQTKINDSIYKEVQKSVTTNMENWFGMESDEAAQFSSDIIQFEFELCKGMGQADLSYEMSMAHKLRNGQDRLPNQYDIDAYYPRITLAELKAKHDNIIDFKQFVENVIGSHYTEFVYLRSSTYLTHLVRTTKVFRQYTISNYILYRALLELNYPPDNHIARRPKHCLQLVQHFFPKVLGEMYQQQVYRENAKHDLDTIFNHVIKAFEQVQGLDENDYRKNRPKFSQYRTILQINEDVDLSDLIFKKEENFWMKFKKVLRFNSESELNRLRNTNFDIHQDLDINAYDIRTELASYEQAVLVGWGLLQQPFYNYFYPSALKYAVLGQRLARTLLLSFRSLNNLHGTTQWDKQPMNNFRNLTECYRNQYSNYLYNKPNEFQNATMLRYLIADSSALSIAFAAYVNWLQLIDSNLRSVLIKETVPGLNFTNTQLFFIYFAQTNCWALKGYHTNSKLVPMSKHTIERWITNGPLSNSVEFGKEFGCVLGSYMNPDDKCLIY